MKEICYDAQKVRTSLKQIAKKDELAQKKAVKDKQGYTSKQEKEELERQLKEHQAKAEQAQKQLAKVQTKIEENNSPLKGILDKIDLVLSSKL